MTISEVTGFLDQCFPRENAMEYDNVGILAGDPDRAVTACVLSLDLTAKAIVLSNQTSSVLKFVFGADGFSGGVTATNLVIASGAKLEVDARGYTGTQSKFKLLTAPSVTGAFADSDVTITTDGDSAGAHIEWRNGSLVFVNPRGMTLILR